MHDFGIIPDIKEFMNSSPYEYVPEKYNCISIGMDTFSYIMTHYYNKISNIKTMLIDGNPYYGLDESGITIITKESFEEFRTIIFNAYKESESLTNININLELKLLLDKVDEAIQIGECIVHYGI
jgi:hypothetical protein